MKAKTKALNPVELLAKELADKGVLVQHFRFASSIPLLLVTSRRNGYRVWVGLHIDNQPWSRECVEQFIHTNFGAMVGAGLDEILYKLKNHQFLEYEDRQEARGSVDPIP